MGFLGKKKSLDAHEISIHRNEHRRTWNQSALHVDSRRKIFSTLHDGENYLDWNRNAMEFFHEEICAEIRLTFDSNSQYIPPKTIQLQIP